LRIRKQQEEDESYQSKRRKIPTLSPEFYSADLLLAAPQVIISPILERRRIASSEATWRGRKVRTP